MCTVPHVRRIQEVALAYSNILLSSLVDGIEGVVPLTLK